MADAAGGASHMSALTGFIAMGLFIDGFAGGGGASTGIAQAIGRDVDIAINHSPTAIAIHKANHPGTEHYCQDIRAVWPKAATRLRPVAGAWFSPDCKEYSKAKGGPVKNRHIRALANEVTHWLKEVRPTVGYLENVEEFEYAAPLDEQGVPIAHLKGKAFDRLVGQWRRLGYRVQWRLLKACDYGAPTSRRRLYVIMRCDDQPIVWPKATHGRPDSPAVKSGKLLPYRTAAECIDWSIPVPSIFDRKKDLAEATNRRIAHGVVRYVINAAKLGKAFIIGDRAPHITKFHTGSVGSAMDKEMPTVTANGVPTRQAGATPLGMAEAVLAPHIMTNRNAQKPFNGADEPTHTITAGGAHLNVVQASLVTYGQHGGANRPLDEPHHTIAASKKDTNGIIGATLIGVGGRRGQSPPMPLDGSYPTTTAKADAAIATAELAFLDRQFGNSNGAAADEPIGTTTAGGSGKSAAVTAFLSSFYGSDKAASGGDPEQPLRTARAGGQHHAVVAAHLEQANGGPRNKNSAGRSVDRPLSTATTTGSQQRVVETTLIEEGALPPEMMERAVKVAAFLVKYYGEGGQHQAVDRPLDVVTTRARYAVVTVTIDAVTYVIVDIGLRMLIPRELANANGFPANYVLDPECWYTTEPSKKYPNGRLKFGRLPTSMQISAIGNSVCPPVARALVAANHPGMAEMRLAA